MIAVTPLKGDGALDVPKNQFVRRTFRMYAFVSATNYLIRLHGSPETFALARCDSGLLIASARWKQLCDDLVHQLGRPKVF